MISRIVTSPIWYQGMPLQARLIEKDRAPRIADLPLLGFVCASLSTNLISIGVMIYTRLLKEVTCSRPRLEAKRSINERRLFGSLNSVTDESKFG